MTTPNDPAWISGQQSQHTSWQNKSLGGGGGAVSSVAGRAGAVVLSTADVSGLAAVATSGAYTDLTGKPTVPTVGAAGAGATVALSSTDGSTTNARTPTAHAASHATGGTDPLTPAAIGAAPAVEAVNTVATSGAAQTLPDPTTQSISRLTLTANCALTFPTAVAGKSLTLVLVQDATGSRTVTWPGGVKWAGGTPPTLSTGAGKIDYLSFVCTDGANWAGFPAGLDMR